MIGVVSPATGRLYPVKMRCEAFGVPRSSFYASAGTATSEGAEEAQVGKRGPKTALSDAELVDKIRETINQSPFHGEGYRKVHARLGLRVGKDRVLRLMRENGLLAPVRRVHPHGLKAHDGTIITAAPDLMWGTDATRFDTAEDGMVWFFGALDHCVADVVGWHVAKVGNRFAALEPVRQGVHRWFGPAGKDVARGLKLRHDHGTQYMSRDFQAELAYLGIASSPAFVREPEGNGVAERFMRTLKEQCLYLHRFRNLEEARAVISKFIQHYNDHWILQRLEHRSPLQARREHLQRKAA
ncbi:MAG: DDE-type integrase/transposase/recombinase [Firmicutes bacterium]|nr:DDE-type integrase/transposase/recombinase [Bacillota bacterium]